jgi:hypothetical protein
VDAKLATLSSNIEKEVRDNIGIRDDVLKAIQGNVQTAIEAIGIDYVQFVEASEATRSKTIANIQSSVASIEA